ncbi:MAG: ribosome small subunit-dependent GTPase A [Akkermansia muciniphila]|nr:ribosome small subunit-dependent GTPase A [Akkermansia muciniphila]
MKVTPEMLGWNDALAEAMAALQQPDWYPARIIRETKINFTVIARGKGDHEVVMSGKLWHDAATDADLPTVGDWVAVDPGEGEDLPVIRALLPRRNRFSRKAPGRSCAEQVIGANVDVVLVVTDAENDYNLNRTERYLTLIRRCGAKPVVLINKIDTAAPEAVQRAVAEVSALGVEVYPVSACRRQGYPKFLRRVPKGMTITIVGSSGVGKSTLVNSLLRDYCLETGEVNSVTGRGRHTTVARELVVLPGGGVLIDNPGMREIQMWTDAATLRAQFSDLEALAGQCRFADCSHRRDAGCAIRAALESGELSPERYEHFLNLDAEIAELERRAEKRRMTVERVTKRRKHHDYRNREDREEHHSAPGPRRRKHR